MATEIPSAAVPSSNEPGARQVAGPGCPFHSINAQEYLKKAALIGTALVIGMIGSAAAATTCNSFPNNVVTGNVNDDVFADSYTCTIAASAFVNGNVLQVGDGGLVIRGIVNGAAEEAGNGSIVVAKGEVGGNLTEADAGNITIRGGSTIEGSVDQGQQRTRIARHLREFDRRLPGCGLL